MVKGSRDEANADKGVYDTSVHVGVRVRISIRGRVRVRVVVVGGGGWWWWCSPLGRRRATRR